MSPPTPTEVQERRLSQARRIADHQFLWKPLNYMDARPLGTIEGGGDPTAMRRFLIVTTTDGDEDGWGDFEDDIPAVEDRIKGLVHDEWGLTGVWDLDREDMEPLTVTVTVSIDMEQEAHPNG